MFPQVPQSRRVFPGPSMRTPVLFPTRTAAVPGAGGGTTLRFISGIKILLLYNKFNCFAVVLEGRFLNLRRSFRASAITRTGSTVGVGILERVFSIWERRFFPS